MRNIEDDITQLELEINLMESAVEVARRRLAGDDEEWEKKKERVLSRMCDMVLQFKVEDPPHKAVAILSRMFEDAREMDAQEKLVRRFDEKRNKLYKLRAEEERRKEARQEAEHLLGKERKWRSAIG